MLEFIDGIFVEGNFGCFCGGVDVEFGLFCLLFWNEVFMFCCLCLFVVVWYY